MRFSPNTLNAVIAVLSVDGLTDITPDRLNAALQTLLGEANTSLDLQPGEIYLVQDEDHTELVEFSSRDNLDAWLEDTIAEDDSRRTFARNPDEYLSVYIARRQLKVEAEQTLKVTIS